MKWLIPAIFVLTCLPVRAEDALEKSNMLLKCIPMELHFAELARQAGNEAVLKSMDDMMRGTIAAVSIILREAGYPGKYISNHSNFTVKQYETQFQAIKADKEKLDAWTAECTTATRTIQGPVLQAQREKSAKESLQ